VNLTPSEIVAELNKFIIGQQNAKKAVAIALRNRFRRQNVAQPLQAEITPKNILLIGPTGVGKTEIARRLAHLADAPFIKVEATKFTEVGYVGKDVDSIIRDLVDITIKKAREKQQIKNMEFATQNAIERVLDILLPSIQNLENNNSDTTDTKIANNRTREKFKQRLVNGELDENEIEIELNVNKPKVELLGPPGLEDLTAQIQTMFDVNNSSKKNKHKVKIKIALKLIADEESLKLINEDELKINTLKNIENNGIVFLDEIDKIISRNEHSNADISRSGVQRDLLPLIEGTTVSTKYGIVKTDHILFIGSGAFHLAKPSDLLPELQGRFPIRVELHSLTVNDFVQILTATNSCLCEQYCALLSTEKCQLKFTKDGILKIAQIAFQVNEKTENIGARRLYTIMEKLLEEVLFAPEKYPKLSVNAQFVEDKLEEIAQSEDLSRYIL
jgi:ATP-dependent HslUV protease ATP-binding subunit HslU